MSIVLQKKHEIKHEHLALKYFFKIKLFPVPMIIIIIAQEIILLYKSIFYVGCLRKKVVCSIELFTPRSEQSASSKKRRTTSSSSFAPDQFSDNIDLEDLIDNL